MASYTVHIVFLYNKLFISLFVTLTLTQRFLSFWLKHNSKIIEERGCSKKCVGVLIFYIVHVAEKQNRNYEYIILPSVPTSDFSNFTV